MSVPVQDDFIGQVLDDHLGAEFIEKLLPEYKDALVGPLLEQLILSECLGQLLNEEKSAEVFQKKMDYRLRHIGTVDTFVERTLARIDKLPTPAARPVRMPGRAKFLRLPLRLHTSRTAQRPLLLKAVIYTAAAVLFVLGMNFAFQKHIDPVAHVVDAKGGLHIQRSGRIINGTAATLILPGDLIVSKSGYARILYRDEDTWIELGPDSTLEMAGAERQPGKCVTLREGTLTSDISPQPAESPMYFYTAQLRGKILGTRIKLSASRLQSRLSVEHGRVETLDLVNRQVALIEGGATTVVQSDVHIPLLSPLDSISHEQWRECPELDLADLVRKYERQARLYSEPLSRLAVAAGDGTRTYGRIRGYIIPPRDGNYVLTLDSSAQTMAAFGDLGAPAPGASKPGQWACKLQKGRRYAFEIHYLFKATGQHLNVSWEGPGFSSRVIDNQCTFDPFIQG